MRKLNWSFAVFFILAVLFWIFVALLATNLVEWISE